MSTATAVAATIGSRLVDHEQKDLLRFVVVGSVDDGKSTLIGRLLFEGHGLYDDQIAAARRASRQTGLELDFSLFTDGLKAEREQGITIDVAYRYFATENRKYIVADTPGHPQYTRNMATGASTAQVAIILIDARLGVLPQSRRHAYLAALLGIPHLAVAINKMDLVGFDPKTFAAVSESFERFASSLGFASVSFFPISATGGDNVTTRSERTPWYSGPTILEYLEHVPTTSSAAQGPLRFPVQLVVRPHLDYRGFAGQIATGRVRVGDEVVASPSGQRSRVVGIDTFDGPLREASAPQSVTLRLADETDLSRGEMLSSTAQPTSATELEASLVWLGDRPLQTKRPYLVKHTTRRVRAHVATIAGRIDLETLGEEPAERLEKNDIGRVTLACHRPIFCDPYRTDRATGAFILIDPETNETVGAGMIQRTSLSTTIEPGGPVTPEERRQRFGHGGLVLQLPTAARSLAEVLERRLFEQGHVPVRVDSESAAREVANAGLLALWVSDVVAADPGSITRLSASTNADAVLEQLTRSGALDAL